MINDQNGQEITIEERQAQIEEELRSKYLNGGDPAELMQEAVQELVALKTEYEELQLVMNEYEREFEDCKNDLEVRLAQSEKAKTALETKLAKSDTGKAEYKQDADKFEVQLEKLQKELQKTVDKGLGNQKRVVSLEIENEELQNETRHLAFMYNDLELKFDTQLEEIELLQNELEEQKLHSEEQIERQKCQLMELTGDLHVKERELKVLKFKSLFETPAREKRPSGGSFVAPHSARTAACLGRSVTRTSDEFRKMPLLDVLPQHTSNGKFKGELTMKHRRDGSVLSRSIIVDGEEQKRRKTVGFREESLHRKLTISQKGDDLDESKPAASAGAEIAIDDVDSKHSHSIFEKASEIIEQKSFVKEESTQNFQDGMERKDHGAVQEEQQESEQLSARNSQQRQSTFYPKPQQAQLTDLPQEDITAAEDPEANFLHLANNSSIHKLPLNESKKRSSFKKPANSNKRPIQTFDLSTNLMKMNDLDFDELLECAEENIENSAFFSSSVKLMGIIDSTISAIDERLTKKKSRILNNLPSAKNGNTVKYDQHQSLLPQKCH